MMIVTLLVVAIVNVATESYERRDTVTALDHKKKRLERSLSKVQTLTALCRVQNRTLSFFFVLT